MIYRISLFLILLSASIGFCQIQNSEFNIYLVKNTYTKYEPILVKCEYINKNNYSDTIYNMFNEIDDKLIVNLKNSKGENIGHTLLDFIIEGQGLIVNPMDTLIESLLLANLYGKRYEYNESSYFFDLCYLEPDTYRVQLIINVNNKKLNSNLLTFKVRETNVEEEEILDFLKTKII